MGCDYHHFVLKRDVESGKAFSYSKQEVDFDYVMQCCVKSQLEVMDYAFREWHGKNIDLLSEEFSKIEFVSDEDYVSSFGSESAHGGYVLPKSCKKDMIKWFALAVKSMSTGKQCISKLKKTLSDAGVKCIDSFKKLGIEDEVFYDSNGRAFEFAGRLKEDAFFAFVVTC